MKKIIAYTLIASCFACSAFAEEAMEQCKVVDKDGNNLIRQGQADSGYNVDNDGSAWIWVPVGECAKMNAGDFSGVSQAIQSKVHPTDIQEAQTIE